jgi:hypothetical protein
MTPSRRLAPALGVTGSGRLFERRLTMILRDHVPCRLTIPGLFGAGLLVLLALPSWTIADPPDDRDRPIVASGEGVLVARPTPVDDREVALADDDDDDTDKPAATQKGPRVKGVKPPKTEKDPTAPGSGKGKIRIEIDLSELEKSLGPDSEFARKLEELGPAIEKAMKQKFGPGSEFETRMKELGERMDKKFGPGSEFETKMKELGERMEKKFGPGSEFETKMKEKSKGEGQDRDGSAARGKAPTHELPNPSPRPSPRPGRSSREERIKDLESRINKLMLELKRLKADDEKDDEPRGGADKLR